MNWNRKWHNDHGIDPGQHSAWDWHDSDLDLDFDDWHVGPELAEPLVFRRPYRSLHSRRYSRRCVAGDDECRAFGVDRSSEDP